MRVDIWVVMLSGGRDGVEIEEKVKLIVIFKLSNVGDSWIWIRNIFGCEVEVVLLWIKLFLLISWEVYLFVILKGFDIEII